MTAPNYTVITGTFEDGSGTALSGTAVFTPSATVYAEGGPVVSADIPVSARIVSGSLVNASAGPLELLATDNTNVTVEGSIGFWYWNVVITVGGVELTPFSFLLPSSPSTVDLYALGGVAGSTAGFNNPMSTLGDMIYGGASGAATRLAGNTAATLKLLSQTGTGSVSAAPSWVTPSALLPWQFAPETYGALGNGKLISDATISGGSETTLTSATAGFTSADTGKVILINGAGSGSSSTPLVTSITYVNATTVTLGTAASRGVTGVFATYGTDDTSAINSAVSAAATYAEAHNYYAEIVFGPHIYVVASALIQGGSAKVNAQIPLPLVPVTGNPTMILRFTGTRCGSGPPMFTASGDTPAPGTEGTVLLSTLTGQSYSGTYGIPTVMGSWTPEQGSGGGFTATWNNLMPVIDGITFMCPVIPTVTPLDLRSCVKAEIPYMRSLVHSSFTALGTIDPTAGSAAGVYLPTGGNNAHNVVGSLTVVGYDFGASVSECTYIGMLSVFFCNQGLFLDGTHSAHGVSIGQYVAAANNVHIISNAKALQIDILSMQCEGAGQYATEGTSWFIDDSSNYLHGLVHVQTSLNTLASVTVNGAANLEIILDNISTGGTRGWQTPPSVPLTTVALTNPFWRHANVYLTSGGAAVTAIAVNGTATGLTLGTSGTVLVRVPSGATITLTYSSTAPTWAWELD